MSFEKFFTRPKPKSAQGPLKHGQLSKDGKKRFWAYYKGREGWVTVQRFKEAKHLARLP